jgi:hypothetical protein
MAEAEPQAEVRAPGQSDEARVTLPDKRKTGNSFRSEGISKIHKLRATKFYINFLTI